MFLREECYKARSTISTATIIEDNILAFITKYHGARLYSTVECSTKGNLSLEELNYKTTATAFNTKGDLLAIANINIIYIIDIKSKLLLQKIRTFEGEITLLSFVPNSKYLIAGSTHGRVIQYRYDGRSQLSRLCSFGYHKAQERTQKSNYVSAFAFKDELFAATGYGGEIIILRMNSYASRRRIEASKVKIVALAFLNRSQIISANVDGVLAIHSLKKHQVTKQTTAPFTKINSLIVMPNPQFVLVSGHSNTIALIDTVQAKIVKPSYLTFPKEISHICLTKEHELIVILEHREIHKVKLPTTDDLKSTLVDKRLDKAYRLLAQDPMLKGTREHKRVEVIYENLYTQAISALIDYNTKKAKDLLQMFEGIEEKRSDIQAMFSAFEHYKYFINLYLEKKHTLAYALAEKYPALKNTKQYKKMEEKFKEAYTFAQKQVLIGETDLAKEILSPYITVLCKRPMLNLVLKNNSDFISFLQAVNTQDYESIERLKKRNPLFAQIPTLIALENENEQSLESIEQLINQGKCEEATQAIKKLLHVTRIKEELQRLYQSTLQIKNLNNYYENDDFIHCYEVIDSSYNLYDYELSQLLEKHWSKLMEQCEEAALKGDIKAIKRILGPLIHVQTRVDKIGDLLRLAFHVKIKASMAKRKMKIVESFIYSYNDIFGQDSEILLIMQTYEQAFKKKLAITVNIDKRLPRDHWKNTMLASSP